MERTSYVLIGAFASSEAADAYCKEHWEDEPDSSVSDDEYRAWENRNPSWRMKSDLGITYLDSDFVAVEYVANQNEAILRLLEHLVPSSDSVSCIKRLVKPSDNTIVIIDAEALGGFAVEMRSTPLLRYCGHFPSR